MGNKKKFYEIIPDSDHKSGVLIGPKEVPVNFGQEVTPVKGWEHITFRLENGTYAPFMNSSKYANFANEDLKNLIEEVVPPNYPLEFFPIRVTSDKYGDKTYYLIHFKIIFDVIDFKHSKYAEGGGTKTLTIIAIDYEKAKDLDFFNSKHSPYGIVSDKMRRLMRKRNLHPGIEFFRLYYVDPDMTQKKSNKTIWQSIKNLLRICNIFC